MLLTKFDPMKDFRDMEDRLTAAFKLLDSAELSNVSGFSPTVNTREGGVCLSCGGRFAWS
jgi:hypothetical protein